MKRVRASSGRQVVAAAVVDVTAVADMAGAGVTVVVDSEEAAATSQGAVNDAVIPIGA
jgi:hypothetical protein